MKGAGTDGEGKVPAALAHGDSAWFFLWVNLMERNRRAAPSPAGSNVANDHGHISPITKTVSLDAQPRAKPVRKPDAWMVRYGGGSSETTDTDASASAPRISGYR